MKKKYIVFFTGFLLALNVLAWQEVFVLERPQYLKVDFLDVGQGDSIFIETPQGQQILIDGGPNSRVLEKLQKLMPAFDKSLDAVILTHPEKDHMAGILEVLQRYRVDYFLWTGVVKNDAENKKLAEILNEIQNPSQSFLAALTGQEKTKVMAISAGTKIKAGKVIINTLFPLESVAGRELKNTSNDTCIVNRLVFGDSSFLFTCDIGFPEEKQLINLYTPGVYRSEVLKVAHHGSKYSTSELFLESVKPKVAVIEVGKNSYGHPTPETLQRLEKFGINVLRTDKNGDVEIESDGKNIYIKK